MEKTKKTIQEQTGKPVEIWLNDTTLNRLASKANKIIFSNGKTRFCFDNENLVFEMKAELIGLGGHIASAKIISGFGYEAPKNPMDCLVL